MLDYVRSLYNPDGTPIAQYAAFRLNSDVDLPVNSLPLRRYNFGAADHPNPALVPQLRLQAAVPEPGLATLLAVAAGAYGVHRTVGQTIRHTEHGSQGVRHTSRGAVGRDTR